MADIEEPGEIEELDDIPEAVDEIEEIQDEDVISLEKYFSANSNPFVKSIYPVLILNKKMKILYANNACENLFKGFSNLAGNYFIDVFGKAFEIEDIRQIRETILGGNNGYTWKGEAKIKSRNMATIQTKVSILTADLSNRERNEFIVEFDDVTEEFRKNLQNPFMSLLGASILKDNDTGNHVTRVNFYSKRMAEELFVCQNPSYNRINADFIENISFLAAMHDVGKIGTPDDILNKEGPLNDWEWNIMREHTKNGAFILSTYPHPMATEIALSHHEHWDGTGYPYQLTSEMIPLSARIVTIADVYDASRMERTYKPALEHNVSLQKMAEGREKHFDPFLIDVFIKIADDFRDIYEKNIDIKKKQDS